MLPNGPELLPNCFRSVSGEAGSTVEAVMDDAELVETIVGKFLDIAIKQCSNADWAKVADHAMIDPPSMPSHGLATETVLEPAKSIRLS